MREAFLFVFDKKIIHLMYIFYNILLKSVIQAEAMQICTFKYIIYILYSFIFTISNTF